MIKKAVISAAGTGGHIIPALAVARLLREHGIDVLWIGGRRPLEKDMVEGEDFLFHSIDFNTFRSGSMAKRLLFPWRALQSMCKVGRILSAFAPDAVITFGGYTTGPVGFMAFMQRKPLYIHEQNATAGLTNRYLAYLSRKVFSAYPDAFPSSFSANKPDKIKVIGNPLPQAIVDIAGCGVHKKMHERQDGLRILVLGGSQGALFLNKNLPPLFQKVAASFPVTVRHQVGARHVETTEKVYASLAATDALSYTLHAFIDDIAAAYQWADCIICRSGALTVSELAAIGMPSILIPYPHAADDHQWDNAHYLAQKGGAYVMRQDQFDPKQLTSYLAGWGTDPAQLLKMAKSAFAVAKLGAAQELWHVVAAEN